MNIEINGSTYRTTQIYYNPDWWDEWLRKSSKKKLSLFSKIIKQPGNRRQNILGFNNLLLVIFTAMHLK
jgi:hypothetical protein